MSESRIDAEDTDFADFSIRVNPRFRQLIIIYAAHIAPLEREKRESARSIDIPLRWSERGQCFYTIGLMPNLPFLASIFTFRCVKCLASSVPFVFPDPVGAVVTAL